MWKLLFYNRDSWRKVKECKLCGSRSVTISEVIGVCVNCLRERPKEATDIAMKAHVLSRKKLSLPATPPKNPNGIRCGICDIDCIIGPEERGYCGLVVNKDNKLIRLSTAKAGFLEWYYDPLPTNCVAAWFCPATGKGYPKYSIKREGEYGYNNLAVAYGACNLDCLFCQNWGVKSLVNDMRYMLSPEDLASKVNKKVACICFFGGDPSPQIAHALKTAKIALKRASKENRILRICWETNGRMSKPVLSKVVELSLKTGGIVKVDVKAWTPSIYKALTGVDIGHLFDNISFIAEKLNERPEVPLLAISTLLVPGYVDEYEVRMIARYISSLSKDIPYTLLAFHPDYLLYDLPPTSIRHAKEAFKAVKDEGLRKVNIGNQWLLGDYY